MPTRCPYRLVVHWETFSIGKPSDIAITSSRITMSLSPRVRSRLIIASLLVVGNGLAAHRIAAQDQAAALRVEHSAVNANVGGLHLCVPEKWSVLDLVVTNPLDEPREILSATYFDGAPTLQYGRRVWVPARARLTTWLPVLLPKLPLGR